MTQTSSSPANDGEEGIALPTSIADADAAWLTEVLHHDGSLPPTVAVSTVETEQIGVGVGVMGELFVARMTFDGDAPDAPSSVVVKLPSPYEVNRAQGVGLGMYEAEVAFYRDMAARTTARTPHCHFAEIVPGTANFVLVIENLSRLVVADEVAGLDLERATVAIGALARIHGSWWDQVDGEEFDWIPRMWSPRIEGFAGMFPDLWAMYATKFADTLPPGGREAGQAITSNYATIMKTLDAKPTTLVHQDFRCDNLMFAPDGTDVTVIDWQSVGRGASVYDLAYFISGSLDTELRRANERALVDEYVRVLARSGGPSMDAAELWNDYVYAGMTSIAVPVLTGATFDLANERGASLISGMGRRMFTAVVDHDATAMLG